MTESGKKWAVGIYPGDLRRKSVPDMAEFWLRAFCEEVEKRAREKYLNLDGLVAAWETAVSESLDELKRELLGD